MYSGSHKAQLNSFAHHRASLLFAPKLTPLEESGQLLISGARDRQPSMSAGGRLETLRDAVRAGLHGFVPRAPQAAL